MVSGGRNMSKKAKGTLVIPDEILQVIQDCGFFDIVIDGIIYHVLGISQRYDSGYEDTEIYMRVRYGGKYDH